jgi:hypothetical protein
MTEYIDWFFDSELLSFLGDAAKFFVLFIICCIPGYLLLGRGLFTYRRR